jgi:2-C-methyl-D-erythritol 4-phosphate cytidylyltransferase
MQRFVILAAGGSGKRMGTERPKQFLDLSGKPLIVHTMEAFFRFDPTVRFVIALHQGMHELYGALVEPFVGEMHVTLVDGGVERFHSVQNALVEVPMGSVVAVQDAVRPFVSNDLLQRCFDAAEKFGNAVPAIPVTDSIRELKESGSMACDRHKLRAVQTPQCFHSDILKRAYEQPFDPAFTDDASVAERLGETINLVEGEASNFKITTPEDLDRARALLIAQHRSQPLH